MIHRRYQGTTSKQDDTAEKSDYGIHQQFKRAKQLKEDHTQKPVEPEDDGEIVLWNDVLVEDA